MSMLNLKNKVQRNGFDLSEKVAFTAKAGELLPIVTKEVIPGDKFNINLKWFTRTRPVNTAAYTRMREYYDFFFIPTRLLWKDFQPFVTGMTDNSMRANTINTKLPISDRHPYFTTKQLADTVHQLSVTGAANYGQNIFGYSRGKMAAKLLNHLGYGDFYPFIGNGEDKTWDSLAGSTTKTKGNISLNPFPLLAYQKVYQDFYRDAQWEYSAPWTYNIDYLSSKDLNIPLTTIENANYQRSMLDLNYCNWNKDLFMGLLPLAQYKGQAVAIVGAKSENELFFVDSNLSSAPTGAVSAVQYKGQNKSYLSTSGGNALRLSSSTNIGDLSILALRQAEFLQKWKEIAQSGQQDYKHQIEKHFGVSVPDCMSDHVQYIGGTADNIAINEIVNTNITGDNESDIAGKGTGVGSGNINFTAKEHGILMCIYHCVPLLDYATTGVDKLCTKSYFTDYAIPEFDQIGMESVNLQQLVSNVSTLNVVYGRQGSSGSSALGYAPRYIDYKTSYDKVRGGFQFTDLASWCAPISDKYVQDYVTKWVSGVDNSIYKYAFLKVNPQVLDTIFGVNADEDLQTDQFLVNSSFDIKAVRNLDVNGLPY